MGRNRNPKSLGWNRNPTSRLYFDGWTVGGGLPVKRGCLVTGRGTPEGQMSKRVVGSPKTPLRLK